MKKIRKSFSILIILALVLSMMPITTKAALTEIQESTEWSGTINGQKYFTFTPTETGYYDVSVNDSEEVYTSLTFYTSQDGKEIRGLGEAVDVRGEGFYKRNAVYLAGGVSYNVKVDCSDSDEETEMTGYVSFTITKSQDSIYELNDNRQSINTICNGNVAMRFTPEETSVYSFNLEQMATNYMYIDLYELVDGELICIEDQNKNFDDTTNQMDFYLEKGKDYYFELYYSGDLEDGEEIPVYVQLVKGKNVSSISIDEIEFYDSSCDSVHSSIWVNSMKLRINFTDDTSKLYEYEGNNSFNIARLAGFDVYYAGEYNEDGSFHYGDQKVKVTYFGKFSDETMVYIKKKIESIDEKNKLKIDEVVTADLSRWYSAEYLVKPTQSGYYTLTYYTNYGNLSECLETWEISLWDSEDRKIKWETDGVKLKEGETYYFYIMLDSKEEKQESMTNFRYLLTLNDEHMHTFGDWTISKQATINSEGEKTRICSSCDYQETQKISKLQTTPLPTTTTTPNVPKATETPISTPKIVAAPSSSKITSAKNKKKKSISLSWKKVSGATGYQIQYCTNKKFKKRKNKTTTKTKLVIKKLKTKKTYYFRVRAYVLDGNKKVYSKWSTIKKVKVKK